MKVQKKEITLENINTILHGFGWENSEIENIAKLADKKKANGYQGMILLLIAIGSFKIHLFCSKTARKILKDNGMPVKEINRLLDYAKHLDGV